VPAVLQVVLAVLAAKAAPVPGVVTVPTPVALSVCLLRVMPANACTATQRAAPVWVAQVALPIAVVVAVPTPRAMPATVANAGMCALPGKHVSVVPVPVARTGIVPVGKAVVVACASTSKPTLTTAVVVGTHVPRANTAAAGLATSVAPITTAPTATPATAAVTPVFAVVEPRARRLRAAEGLAVISPLTNVRVANAFRVTQLTSLA
jgi:hypothetical protein